MSLNQRFLACFWSKPQSKTRSQYVPVIAAIAEETQATILQPIPLSRLYAVLTLTATMVEIYFTPLYACIRSFSSNRRLRHCNGDNGALCEMLTKLTKPCSSLIRNNWDWPRWIILTAFFLSQYMDFGGKKRMVKIPEEGETSMEPQLQ